MMLRKRRRSGYWAWYCVGCILESIGRHRTGDERRYLILVTGDTSSFVPFESMAFLSSVDGMSEVRLLN